MSINSLLFKMNLTNNKFCRFCNTNEETIIHILCSCRLLCGQRLKHFNKDVAIIDGYTEAALFGYYWFYQGYKNFIVETWDGTTDHRSQCLFAFSKPIIVFYSRSLSHAILDR